MIKKTISGVPAEPVTMEGAKDAKVRVIFGPADGAPTFAMRVFELAPEGHTPYHQHAFEHEVLILKGDIAVVTENGQTPVKPGDAVLIMPGEIHQFRNTSQTAPAGFMCLVPVQYQK